MNQKKYKMINVLCSTIFLASLLLTSFIFVLPAVKLNFMMLKLYAKELIISPILFIAINFALACAINELKRYLKRIWN